MAEEDTELAGMASPRRTLSAADYVEGYRRLVERFGEDRVATAILAKWLLDEDADEIWELLDARVRHADQSAVDLAWLERVALLSERAKREVGWTLKRRVLLWHLSNGKTMLQACYDMNIGYQTGKTTLARLSPLLRLSGFNGQHSQAVAVAFALREGLIP